MMWVRGRTWAEPVKTENFSGGAPALFGGSEEACPLLRRGGVLRAQAWLGVSKRLWHFYILGWPKSLFFSIRWL